ncbi:hypothetical protein FGO68_gene6654 [Halteria grandinella]|uniref:Uncharacterized protein n=1 Tax=Halteria grandinella TaxID=5974 RepID=A0A8J8T3Q6_HALGN|nr:hypothetical protein FGO68_gene6654 [Halteria grandinella]
MSDFDEEGADLNSGFRFSSQEDEAKDNESDGLGLSSSGGESRHAGDSEDDDLFSSEESENSDDPPPDEDSDGATNDKPPKEDEPQEEKSIIDNNEEKVLYPEDEMMTEEDREFLKDHDTQFKVQINPFKWMTNISKDFTQMTDTVNGNTEMTANQKLKKLTHKEKQM